MCDRLKEIFCKLSPEREKNQSTTAWINILCFYVIGTLAFFNQELLYTASEDILSGRNLPTSTVLVCFVAPLMITKIFAPWFIQKLPYALKTTVIAFSMAAGLSLVVFVEDIKVKLLGIALNAMATGLSEVVFLALTSFYPHICISAFVAGTGMASLVSPLYYTGVTTWGCVSPKMAILVTIPLPLLFFVFYTLMDKEDVNRRQEPPQHKEVEYTKVGSAPDDRPTVYPKEELLCGDKLRICLRIMPFIIPLFLSFFAEYMSNSTVITTIAFPHSHVPPRDHFLYYSLSYRIGKFIGRSYLFLFACLPSDFNEFLRCDKTWIFAAIEMAHLIFFLLESWYHFVWYIWIIVCLCSTLGLFAGMIVLHSPHAVARFIAPEEREFALGLLTVGNAVGAFVAGLVGLYVEPYLRDKCMEHFPAEKDFCFTRTGNSSGWDTNIHC